MHRGDGVTSTSSQYTQCIVNRYVRKNEVNNSYKSYSGVCYGGVCYSYICNIATSTIVKSMGTGLAIFKNSHGSIVELLT